MNNLRKAADAYAKTVWNFDFATKAEIDQTCEDFIAGYAHAIAVLRSKEAYKFWASDHSLTNEDWADFLSQHANESAPEGEDD
jgi:hypothetical protein